MLENYKKLIISPHIDDEVLGCGGILDSNTFILECGVDEFHVVSKEDRIKELNSAQKISNFNFITLNHRVNYYELKPLIDDISNTINQQKPDIVFIPYPSYNQDHQTVYKAAMVALRPHDINFFVKKVLVYEEPDMIQWNYSFNINDTFKPNFFTEIDIERKISQYECLKSQNRSFRSSDFLRKISEFRGEQSMLKNAEAFLTLRWIE